MEQQWDLFDADGEPRKLPGDSPAVAERKRLTRQATRVLELLREGPKTNMELVPITMRFGARIFEMRRRGFVIDTDVIDRAAGLVLYTLRKEPDK